MQQRTPTQLHASIYFDEKSSFIRRGKAGSNNKKHTFKVGRDAKTGQFITVKEAQKRKRTAIVETVKKK